MRAIVVGGGIAGLSTAIALRQAGVEADVFERATALEEIGAGLSLWSNAILGLERIGVAGAVRARGAVARRTLLRTSRGDVLGEVSLAGFPAESVGIHRADLQAVLLDALGRDAVRLGAACTGFVQDAEGVTARFADGREERGDVLVGADGLSSVVRAGLFGAAPPRYAGYTGWRAVAALPEELRSPGIFWESWGRGIRFGFVEIGGGRVYWFVSQTAPAGGEARPPGAKRTLLELLRGWHEPVEAVVEASAEAAIFRTDIVDRKPLPRWCEGRVTLAGDAAHAMTPNLGQGAAQGIEDAVALAEALSTERDVEAALRRYEARRVRRANAIVRQSRQAGRLAQLEGPVASRLRDGAMRLLPSRLQRAQLLRLAGLD